MDDGAIGDEDEAVASVVVVAATAFDVVCDVEPELPTLLPVPAFAAAVVVAAVIVALPF